MATGTISISDSVGSTTLTGFTKQNLASSTAFSVGADSAVPGGKFITHDGSDQRNGGITVNAAGSAAADTEILALVYANSQPPDFSIKGGLFVRAQDFTTGSHDLILAGLQTVTGNDTLTVRRKVAGVQSGVNSGNFAWATGTWYAIRLRITGTSLQARVWQPTNLLNPTSGEPGTWNVSATVAAPTGAGMVGFGQIDHASSIERWVPLGWATAGDTAPAPSLPTTLTVRPIATTTAGLWLATVEDVLTWAPPGYPSYTGYATHTINSPTTFLDFGDTPTVVVQNVPMTERFSLRSNTHVVWIGGESLVNSTVDGPTSQRRATMSILPSSTGTSQVGRIVHIEGYLVHGKYAMGDIWIQDPNAIVQVQKCRVEQGMWSRDTDFGDAFNSQHPDCIQINGGCRELRVDGLTGLLTLQGFFFTRQPSSTGPISGAKYLRKVNFRPNLNGTIELWDPVEGQPGAGVAGTARVWPSWQMHVADDPIVGPDPPPTGAIFIDNGTVSFQHNTTQITATTSGRAIAPMSGVVRAQDSQGWYVTYGSHAQFRNWDNTAPGRLYESPPASPDGADWVPEGVAGLDYVSPGYLG